MHSLTLLIIGFAAASAAASSPQPVTNDTTWFYEGCFSAPAGSSSFSLFKCYMYDILDTNARRSYPRPPHGSEFDEPECGGLLEGVYWGEQVCGVGGWVCVLFLRMWYELG